MVVSAAKFRRVERRGVTNVASNYPKRVLHAAAITGVEKSTTGARRNHAACSAPEQERVVGQ